MNKNNLAKIIRKTTPYFVLPLSASLLLCTPAFSQEDDGSVVEEITVTGSRIRSRSGLDTPNPVTVTTPEEISIMSPGNIVDGLAALPQFYNSSTTENTTRNGSFFQSSGAGSLNLRGLDSKRTLQLLDGRRVVASTLYGGPDINLFPEHLLRSVESVTGGASAAYGTNAVAGVVNFILDKDYVGYKAGVQAGANQDGDGDNTELYFSAGWDFGDKAHLMVNIEKSQQDPIYNRNEADWYTGSALLPNTAANAGNSQNNPFYINAPNVVSNASSLYGIVTVGGNKYSLDENANPSPFINGEYTENGAFSGFHSVANGGSGMDNGFRAQVIGESSRENIFTYLDYDISDNLTVFGQYIYGESNWDTVDNSGIFSSAAFRQFTIYDGNPYIPASLQAEMTANGLDSISLSRLISPADGINNKLFQDTEMQDISVGFEYEINGGFFDGWFVEGWYAQGETDVEARQPGGARGDHIYVAADAVVDNNTGQVVCNINRTDVIDTGTGLTYAQSTPSDFQGCEPINLFGVGNASQAALDWSFDFPAGQQVTVDGWLPDGTTIPYSYTSSGEKKRVIALKQDAYEFSASGELAEGWGAGAISMAVGYAWREESYVQFVQAPEGNTAADPNVFPVPTNYPDTNPLGPTSFPGVRGVPNGDANNTVEIQFSKVPFGRGDFEVKEAFTEIDIPLIADAAFMEQLTFNGAARYADYTGSGGFWSWKAGIDWRINDEWRLRATQSQDVRAATMAERFDFTGGLGTVVDYLADPAGTISYSTTTITGGNPDVVPETGETFTAGVVYQPAWLEGLGMSVDYFNVKILDNINQASVSSVSEGCYLNGDVDLCALITRAGTPVVGVPSLDSISLIKSTYINVNSTQATGIDFEINYSTDIDLFGGGEFVGMRLLGTYLDEQSSTNSAGLKTESTGVYGLPEWTTVLSGNYSRGNLRTALSIRYTAETLINLNWNFNGASTQWDVADNTVSPETLVDLNVNYEIETNSGNFNVFANINNLLDADPRSYPSRPRGFQGDVGDGVVGDLRGRRYVVGVNYEF